MLGAAVLTSVLAVASLFRKKSAYGRAMLLGTFLISPLFGFPRVYRTLGQGQHLNATDIVPYVTNLTATNSRLTRCSATG